MQNVIENYAASKNQANFSQGLGQSGSTTPEAAPQTPAGMTAMVGPDGVSYNVPNANVNAFIAAGGKKE
jgi:hypothetical protein